MLRSAPWNRRWADRAGFSLLMNRETRTTAEFNVRCIWRPDHPEFDRFTEILGDPRLGDASVDLGKVSEYRRRASMVGRRLGSSGTARPRVT